MPGVCFLEPHNDFSNPLTSCISPSCNPQSFWLHANLSRYNGGSGCGYKQVWYSQYGDTNYFFYFSAYVEGTPIIPLTTNITADTNSCSGSIKITPSGGLPPYTYLWSPNNQTTDSIGNQCLGTYCCIVTDNKGCTDSSCVVITKTSGINTISNSSAINIFPNPTSGSFTVTGLMQGQRIELYNYMGQKLNSLTANKTTLNFDISDKANGVYLIRILNKDGSFSAQKKIVKQ